VAKYADLIKEKEREVEKARQVVDEVERGQGEMMEKRKNSRTSPLQDSHPASSIPD
jgi:hypothetical protein